MEQMIFWIALLVILPCLVWGLPALFSRNKGKVTGHATVISHRMVLARVSSRHSDNYNRMVSFRLSDGSELELYTTKEAYASLTDGQAGQLTWEKDLFYHFDPDTPQ